MNISSPLPTPRKSSLAVLVFLIVHATAGFAANDPTVPSSLITQRLTRSDGSVRPTPIAKPIEVASRMPKLRLKAIVMRDHSHGTAIVAMADSTEYVITLRRADVSGSDHRVDINGRSLIVRDFSDTFIVLQHPDTDEQFVVN